MATVVLDISISLDGYAAGPNVSDDQPMGEGGERLHDWMGFDGEAGAVDRAVREASDAAVGAAVVGRRTYDIGRRFWGGTPWAGAPAFVVTHRPEPSFETEHGDTFAFDALEPAVRRAREAAGDAEVRVLGPTVGREALRAGLVDELRLQIVPILLGGGTPLFDGNRADLEPIGEPVVGSVTFLRFRVRRPGR